MTRPAVFGDFAQLTRHHLEGLPRPASGARPNPDIVALQIPEYFYGLLRVLRVMSRYAAEVGKSLQPPGGQGSRAADPWAQAQSDVRQALQSAHLMNPFLHGSGARHYAPSARGEIAIRLAAAAETMYAGRDLLQTHFRTGPDGTRQPLTGWSAAIASAPVGRELLAEIGGWARQIVTCTADLTTTPTMGNAKAFADQRRLSVICDHLSAAAAAVQTAQDLNPLPEKDQRQLYAIQVNVLQPRRQPAGAESAADLCRGIAETSERTRQTFAAAVPQAAWSPELTAESLRETVAAAAVISHHSQLIQEALADRAADLGALRLTRKLVDSAHSSAQASQAWLSAAGAWESIRTDATSGTPSATTAINDLVLWTGSLAYASPNWRPGRQTAGDRRAPEILAPGLADISLVADAVHQAATSIVASAAADYTRIRTAALAGRLLTSVETTRSGEERVLFTRATRYQATRLLGAYRDAGAASAKAVGSLAAVAEAIKAHNTRTSETGRPQPGCESGQVVSTRIRIPLGRGRDPVSPAARAEANAGSEMPGPMERVLVDLGVTNPALIERGVIIDEAASQLLDEAAQDTAGLRWNTAVTSSQDFAVPGRVIDRVLAHGSHRPALPAAAFAARAPERQAELEALEAEP